MRNSVIAEFERHTGGKELHIFSIESVIEAFSSVELNHMRAQEFRNLALAVKVDLTRTPTDAAVHWFLTHRDKYTEALHSVCRWEQSPSEVDQKAFRAWASEHMEDIEGEKVNWTMVFCELFL